MDRTFSGYRFSRHFNHLTYLGMWTLDIFTTPTLRMLHLIFRTSVYFLLALTLILQMVHLCYVFDSFEKVTFNLCSSTLVVAVVFKLLWLYERREWVNELRVGFWQDFQELDREEDLAELDRAFWYLNFIYYSGYGFLFSTLIAIVVSHYYAYSWGSTELPFAAYLPIDYPKALFTETVGVIYVSLIAAENEFVGFSLILQLNAHYEILMNRIRRLNELYTEGEKEEEEEQGRKEQEKGSVREKAKGVIVQCVRRHLQLMQYTYKLKEIYNRSNVLTLFVGAFLILMNGVELFVFVKEFNQKIASQMLIIVVLVNDLLLLCHFISKLTTQCLEVGDAAYSTVWYRMDRDIQMGLYMIMIGSKKPPKVTAGKIILVDLNTYMHLLRNILSWLMLIRQLVNQRR